MERFKNSIDLDSFMLEGILLTGPNNTTVDTRGRVVVPERFREQYGQASIDIHYFTVPAIRYGINNLVVFLTDKTRYIELKEALMNLRSPVDIPDIDGLPHLDNGGRMHLIDDHIRYILGSGQREISIYGEGKYFRIFSREDGERFIQTGIKRAILSRI